MTNYLINMVTIDATTGKEVIIERNGHKIVVPAGTPIKGVIGTNNTSSPLNGPENDNELIFKNIEDSYPLNKFTYDKFSYKDNAVSITQTLLRMEREISLLKKKNEKLEKILQGIVLLE